MWCGEVENGGSRVGRGRVIADMGFIGNRTANARG
jgi:hypothetical protein